MDLPLTLPAQLPDRVSKLSITGRICSMTLLAPISNIPAFSFRNAYGSSRFCHLTFTLSVSSSTSSAFLSFFSFFQNFLSFFSSCAVSSFSSFTISSCIFHTLICFCVLALVSVLLSVILFCSFFHVLFHVFFCHFHRPPFCSIIFDSTVLQRRCLTGSSKFSVNQRLFHNPFFSVR